MFSFVETNPFLQLSQNPVVAARTAAKSTTRGGWRQHLHQRARGSRDFQESIANGICHRGVVLLPEQEILEHFVMLYMCFWCLHFGGKGQVSNLLKEWEEVEFMRLLILLWAQHCGYCPEEPLMPFPDTLESVITHERYTSPISLIH